MPVCPRISTYLRISSMIVLTLTLGLQKATRVGQGVFRVYMTPGIRAYARCHLPRALTDVFIARHEQSLQDGVLAHTSRL